MTRILNKAICFLLAATLLTACKKSSEPNGGAEQPAVETDLPKADGSIDEIGVQTVVRGDVQNLNNVEFSIKVSGGSKPTEYGIAYSTNLRDMKRKTAWRKKGSAVNNGVSSVKMDLLYNGATYYYAAYSILEGSCYYGDVMSFSTPKASVGDYVYLGVSVPWADRNLGAESPVDRGNIYYWADVTPAGATCNLYFKLDDRQWMDKSDICGTQYDAAKAAWGDDWRLPTQKEMQELALNCKWELVTTEGKKVFKVSSKKEALKGNYIYIPITGVLYNGDGYEHDEFSPTIKHTDEAAIMTGTQTDNQTHSSEFGGGKDLRWCYALEYSVEDYNYDLKPSVDYLNPKAFGYTVRPVYIEQIIN